MRVLVVNAGSSSLKVRLVASDDGIEASCELERWDGEHDLGRLQEVLAGVPPPDVIGHRVVHGGTSFVAPVALDAHVEAELAALDPLAPLHQQRAIAGMRAVRRIFPDVVAVACFDTAFHRTMPAATRTYALPAEWRAKWPLERFGFHGLSHAYAARRAAAMIGAPIDTLRTVTCHLGAGASLCAVDAGRSVATTMGFTPLEGLVMVTRSGSVDPGLVLWLVEHAGIDAAEVRAALEHRSGLAGLSGTSGDLRDVMAAADAGDASSRLALDVYVGRLAQEIAAMTATMHGLDALVFTGGIGEHAPTVRARAAAALDYLGVEVDPGANAAAGPDAEITAPGARVRTLVVEAREDLEIARQVRALLHG